MQSISLNGCVFQILENGGAVLTECVQGCSVMTIPASAEGHPVIGVEYDAFDHAGPIGSFRTEAGHPGLLARDGVLFDRKGECLLRYPAGCRDTAFAVPEGTREIGSGAFSGAEHLERVMLPEGVLSVGGRAFADCAALKAVQLPLSLEKFGHEVFCGCKALAEVRVPENHAFLRRESCFLVDRREDMLLLCLPAGVPAELTAPEGIRHVDDYAFYGCDGLESICFHHGLRALGRYAFYHCRSLQSAGLQEGLRIIGSRAFSGCGELKNLFVPDSVTSIEYKAFNNCVKLVLQVNKGSYADRYCRQFGFPCHYRHHWPWQKDT